MLWTEGPQVSCRTIVKAQAAVQRHARVEILLEEVVTHPILLEEVVTHPSLAFLSDVQVGTLRASQRASSKWGASYEAASLQRSQM